MKHRYIFLPKDFADIPDRDLGLFGIQQKKLVSLGVSVPKTAYLAPAALKDIATTNRLAEKIGPLLQETNFSDPIACTKLKKNIAATLTTAKIPSAVLQELGEMYHEYFLGKKVDIFSNKALSKSGKKTMSGDARVFQALLEHWAEAVTTSIFTTRTRHIHIPLFSLGIVLQEVLEPTLHGVVYTRNPFTGVKTSVCIISNATTQPRSLLATAAQFEVDIRTWNIVSRPQRNYTTALTDSQVIALARMAYAIKTQHLEHKCIHWDMVRGNPVVSHIEDFDVTLQLPTFQKTITQLYISAGNPHRVQDYKELPISGIGYLKSEYTLLQHGMHPLALLRSGKKKHIQNSITQTLQTFEPLHQVHHIVYKSFDVPSSELAQFKHATTYEPTETTPWLGARGAYKHLQQPELLVTELEAVNAFAATTQKHISFLLPFVRSATELHRLNTLCSKHIRTQHFSLWAQLATPEPFLNPGAYPFAAIKGISIQLDTLVQLLLGVAPASEVTQQYHLESTVLKTILQPFMSYMKLQHPQVAIHIQMEHYTRSYAELAISLGCTALTVRPAVAPLAKACIIDTEAAPFLSTHTRITTI